MALDLKEKVELISERLSLVDGLLHVQFILDSGRYWFVEMTRRCPGDLYSLLIEMSTGFYTQKAIFLVLSEKVFGSRFSLGLQEDY